MKVFVSNKLTELAQVLHQKLFSETINPLEKRWVIVSSEEVKLDLYLQWLETSAVVTGLKTITYNELIRKMFPELPSKMELALRIETILDTLHERSPCRNSIPSGVGKAGQNSVNSLNREESPPFHGGVLQLKNYLIDQSPARKIELSCELSSLFLKYLQNPAEELLEWRERKGWQQVLWKELFGDKLVTAVVRPLAGSFYFYNLSTIASLEWKAFSEMDTSWFLFSPSEMYTGDLLPQRQQKFLLRKVKKTVRENLTQYFEHDSPLLSNWIGHGQTLFQYFEDAETIELFKEPAGLSALHQLQREWLTLEKAESLPDLSIQLHSAPNLLREVEVVWEIIQRLPFSPREILVLTPDIQSYAAPIEWVFKQRGGPFAYSITGIEARRHSPLLQGLEILLSFPSYRFSRDVFKKLLLCSPFLKRFQLNIEDAEMLDSWMSEMHLRYDLSGHTSSWHGALKRVIEGLVISGSFDFSDTPLINSWIEITLKLENELSPLSDQQKRSGSEWAALIERWIEIFFESDEETDILRSLLATLRQERVEGLFPYETIEHHLQAAFKNPSGSIHRSTLETVRFTSLKEGSIVPAKAIICMGMQEGSFPRMDPPSSLPTLSISNRILEDRYLFLEIVSHAQENLILTYQRCHPDDGKEVLPSPLIQELIQDRGRVTTVHHPLSALDPLNYQPGEFRSFSTTHFNLLHTSKMSSQEGSLQTQITKTIDMRVLRKLARHPVQCFLEEGLGLRFPWKEIGSEFLFSPLEMHHLRKASLKVSTGALIDTLDKEGKLPTGTFRSAALQSIEKELDAYHKTLAHLEIDPASVFSLELTSHTKILTRISDDRYVAPALKITLSTGGVVELQGTIEGVSPKGLLFHGEESTEDLLKIWPLYVAVQAALGETSLILTKKESLANIHLQDPYESLGRYLLYLQKSLQTPSPLLPAWGRRIFKGEDLPSKTDDEILLWAKKRNLLPSYETWIVQWKPYLLEVVRELI